MKRVTGIGGIFFKAKDPETPRDWYRTRLGIEVEPWGGTVLRWANAENPSGVGATVWNVMAESSTYLDPGKTRFMINYRVEDLHALLAKLTNEGCEVDAKVEESEYDKFGWVMDPEGNRIELWQPPDGQ